MKKIDSKHLLLSFLLLALSWATQAQTDQDAIMMQKKNLCTGPMVMHSQWSQYWEGKKLRSNENIGTLRATTYTLMGNYGIKNNLNLLYGFNYVHTRATQGVLQSMRGFQDASLMIKYMPIEKQGKESTFSLYTIVGGSIPMSRYTADFFPLSIGFKSRNVIARLMADYQYKHFFITGSATYLYRSNVMLDRNSYYTDRLIYSNEVAMPDVFQGQVRVGYRSEWLIAELLYSNWTTLGGFDITRNNMPFVSNRMNMHSIGFNTKWTPDKSRRLSFIATASQVVEGRNVGQSSMYGGGIFYIINTK